MGYERFIARRLFFQTRQGTERPVSRPAVRIAVTGIAVGLAVMLVSVAVVIGFKHQIERNVVGVGSHLQVTSQRSGFSFEMEPIDLPDGLTDRLQAIPNVAHVQRFTTKPGVVKTGGEVQTVVFKGVAADFDWGFLSERLTAGRLPEYAPASEAAAVGPGRAISGQDGDSDLSPDSVSTASGISVEVLISKYLANLLRLEPGDALVAYFTRGEQIAARKLRVSGVFDTHFPEFDKVFVLADCRLLARLNLWDDGQVGGLEISVDDIRQLGPTDVAVYDCLYDVGHLKGNAYYQQSVYELNPEMFGWLDLLDMNVWLILALMLLVSGYNMVSGLLILMLERTTLIGMLKAMGAPDFSVRRVFLHLSALLVGKGMLWGNVLGLGLCAVQYFFHVIPLDPDVYYVPFAPIEFNLWYILLVNLGTAVLSMLMMLLPTALVSRIVPVKSIRFD